MLPQGALVVRPTSHMMPCMLDDIIWYYKTYNVASTVSICQLEPVMTRKWAQENTDQNFNWLHQLSGWSQTTEQEMNLDVTSNCDHATPSVHHTSLAFISWGKALVDIPAAAQLVMLCDVSGESKQIFYLSTCEAGKRCIYIFECSLLLLTNNDIYHI